MSEKRATIAAGVKATLADLGKDIEAFLAQCLRNKDIPERLLQAMEYSLLAGGKRVRPALCLTFAGLFGLPRGAAMPMACALECIHTYSLIHDDLPAMDNDDLRRGRPSNHKAFDEATAILAGDGLLTEAFGLMAESAAHVPAERAVKAMAEAAKAAGAAGMVGGQVLDMEYTAKAGVALDQLKVMHALKTGALLTASCTCGALLAGAGDEDLARTRGYGRAVGAAFQIVDDILDVIGDEKQLGKPVGSDQAQGKTTYPSLVGLERSRAMAEERVAEAVAFLASYSGPEVVFLRDLAQYILDRAH